MASVGIDNWVVMRSSRRFSIHDGILLRQATEPHDKLS